MSLNEESEYKRKHEPKKNASNRVQREPVLITKSNSKSAQIIHVSNEEEVDGIVKEEKQVRPMNVRCFSLKLISSYTSLMNYPLVL